MAPSIRLAFSHVPGSGMHGIGEVFHALLNHMLDNESTTNDISYIGKFALSPTQINCSKHYLGMVIDLLLDQTQDEGNTDAQPSIVGTLYRIPIQGFTRQQREKLLKWHASTPEVLSLKKRMLQGSILGTVSIHC